MAKKYYLLKEKTSDGTDVIQKLSTSSLEDFIESCLKKNPQYLKKKVPLHKMIDLLYLFSRYELAELPEEGTEIEFSSLSNYLNVKLSKRDF